LGPDLSGWQRGRQKTANRQEWQDYCFAYGIPSKDDVMRINIFLADNLTALAEAKAPVAEWLAQNAPAPETIIPRIFTNQHGIVDWRLGEDRSLFAAMHPAMLYRDWRPKDKAEGGATVIIGTALGYGLNHVLTGTPRSHKVLVVEPRPEMLVACLGQTDYRPFLAAGKLAFLPPDAKLLEKALTSLDVSFLFARINLRSDLPSTQLGPEYAQASALVRAKLESLSVELTTLRHKQETMVGNELRNYARAMEDGSLSRMAGMARGVPTVVLGAGPSLPRFVPALLRHRDKALFVAALQTLPVLERLGLAPDLCLGLDFNDSMNRCLDNLQDNNFAADIPLIYSTKMQPAVLDRYPGPKIPLWTQGGIATFVLKDQELVLDAGGPHLGRGRPLLPGRTGPGLEGRLDPCPGPPQRGWQLHLFPAARRPAQGHQGRGHLHPPRVPGRQAGHRKGHRGHRRVVLQHLRRRRGHQGRDQHRPRGPGAGRHPAKRQRRPGSLPGSPGQGGPAPGQAGLFAQGRVLGHVTEKRLAPAGKTHAQSGQASGGDQGTALPVTVLHAPRSALHAVSLQRNHGHGRAHPDPQKLRCQGIDGLQSHPPPRGDENPGNRRPPRPVRLLGGVAM